MCRAGSAPPVNRKVRAARRRFNLARSVCATRLPAPPAARAPLRAAHTHVLSQPWPQRAEQLAPEARRPHVVRGALDRARARAEGARAAARGRRRVGETGEVGVGQYEVACAVQQQHLAGGRRGVRRGGRRGRRGGVGGGPGGRGGGGRGCARCQSRTRCPRTRYRPRP